jgi:hypothetical protein
MAAHAAMTPSPCKTTSKFGKDLIAGLSEALAHAEGREIAARVHSVEVPDVQATSSQPKSIGT